MCARYETVASNMSVSYSLCVEVMPGRTGLVTITLHTTTSVSTPRSEHRDTE